MKKRIRFFLGLAVGLVGVSSLASAATSLSVISSVRVENAYGSGAQVRWVTDTATDSVVLYGTSSGSYQYSVATDCYGTLLTTNHCVNLTGLTPGAIYYYKIGSRSLSSTGATLPSTEYQFTAGVGDSNVLPSGTAAGTTETNSSDSSTTTTDPVGTTSQGGSTNEATTIPKETTATTTTETSGGSDPVTPPSSYSTSDSVYTPPRIFSTATLSGRVLDPAGVPVPKAFVHIVTAGLATSLGVETNALGFYSFVNLNSDTYTVEVSVPPGSLLLEPRPQSVSVGVGEKKTLDISLFSGPKKVSGRVIFTDGSPVPDAMVVAYSRSTGQSVQTTVSATGGYSLDLSGGRWQLEVHPSVSRDDGWYWEGVFPELVFSQEASQETRAYDFKIVKLDSTIEVKTVDEVGRPLVGVGVTLDGESSYGYASGAESERRISRYKVTDVSGVATFAVPSGATRYYYVRGSINQAGVLEPEQKTVAVPLPRKEYVELVFAKAAVATSKKVVGVTRLASGNASAASVWAWSEKGRTAEAKSDTMGNFSLELAGDDRWHLSATREGQGIVYKSNEIVVDSSKEVGSVEIFLTPVDSEAWPDPVKVVRDSSQTIVALADSGAQVSMPSGSVSIKGQISLEMRPTVEVPPQPAAQIMSTVYDVRVTDTKGTNISSLSRQIEVVLPYDEAFLSAKKVGESDLMPSYFDEKTGAWVRIDDYSIDKVKNVIIARVNHLTRFAIIAAADITPPLSPRLLSATALGGGLVRTTWKNPETDFDHAKVYRSDRLGSLGKLVAEDIKADTYVDRSEKDGATYYYAVRAVDSAGNETANNEQVAVVALGIASQASSTTQYVFKRSLGLGVEGADVTALQQRLIKEGVYPEARVTGYFGNLTMAAVVRYQEKYREEILVPAALTKGSGFVGQITLRKLNK
jgi:fibronectin type 3 domain-containing protein